MNFVLIHVLCLRALFVKFVPILTKVFYGLVVDFYFWRGTLIFCIISDNTIFFLLTLPEFLCFRVFPFL